MNIQLSVIVTQSLGFLIVFWVLRKFAWGPILKLLEERREKIRASFEDIEAQKAEAAKLRAKYEEDLRQIDARARQRMNEVLAEAQKMAGEIEADARENARKELDKLKEDVERQYQAARVRLKEEIVTAALTSAERMVRESLDRDRQRKLVEEFLKDLDSAEAEPRS